MRSTMPVASSPRCSDTSRRTLSRSRSWMWRSTACLAVCAAMRLKASDGRATTVSLPFASRTRLLTSRAPVVVSSFTVTMPGGLKALTYAAPKASSTVRSISGKGMPNSAQSAFSASARLSVDGSDTDREPARGNVIPSNVNNHRRTPARSLRLDSDARAVDRDELAFNDRFRLPCPIAHVHPLTVKTRVVLFSAQRAFGARRGDLEVVRSWDQGSVVEHRPDDAADARAVFDGDRLDVIDRHAQRAPRLAPLLHRVQLIAHGLERRLEPRSDRRYRPWRQVFPRSPTTTLQPAGASRRQEP